MTITNFLTDPALIQNFLSEGALIQISPDEFRVFIGPFKPSTEENSGHESIFYTTDFWCFLKEQNGPAKYYRPLQTFTLTRSQMIDFVADKRSTLGQIKWTLPSSIEFKQQYDWIQQQIGRGVLVKALPIARQEGQGSLLGHLAQVLSYALHHAYPNSVYGLWSATQGLVGATPEVLCHWQKKSETLRTMALAGTWKKSEATSINFNDPKIQQEHAYVIQDIETQLKDFKLLEKSSTEVVELPHLFHLKTTFTYGCESRDEYLEVIRRLHPTAALGLFPRDFESTQKFSQFELQKHRKQFGAPIGFINAEEGFMLVGIRNVMWNENHIELFAGCGVTQESIFEEEWKEILAKQEAVKKMLGLES